MIGDFRKHQHSRFYAARTYSTGASFLMFQQPILNTPKQFRLSVSAAITVVRTNLISLDDQLIIDIN